MADLVGRVQDGRDLAGDAPRSPRPTRRRRPGSRGRVAAPSPGPCPRTRPRAGGTPSSAIAPISRSSFFHSKAFSSNKKAGLQPAPPQTATLYQIGGTRRPRRRLGGRANRLTVSRRDRQGPCPGSRRPSAIRVGGRPSQLARSRKAGEQGRDGHREEGHDRGGRETRGSREPGRRGRWPRRPRPAAGSRAGPDRGPPPGGRRSVVSDEGGARELRGSEGREHHEGASSRSARVPRIRLPPRTGKTGAATP